MDLTTRYVIIKQSNVKLVRCLTCNSFLMSGDLPKSTVCFRHLVIAGLSIGTSCDRGCCCASLASTLASAAGGAAFSKSGATTARTASAQLLRSWTTSSIFPSKSGSTLDSSNNLATASSGAPATLSSWSGVHRAKSTMVRNSRNVTSSRELIETRCWYLKILFCEKMNQLRIIREFEFEFKFNRREFYR